ncbi:MAG: carboxypeptidase-like regulatory domain-containing protein [Myxococcaceae bacterium]
MRRAALAAVVLVLALVGGLSALRGAPANDPPGTNANPPPELAPSSVKWAAPITPHGERTLRGVVKRRGAPVSGATVTALADRPPLGLSHLPRCPHSTAPCANDDPDAFIARVEDRTLEAEPLARAITADDGTFELRGLGDAALTVWAERDDALGVQVQVAPSTEHLELELHAGRMIRGRVMHGDASPAEGALVTVITDRAVRLFEAIVRPDGRFELGPVPRSTLAVVISEPGFVAQRAFIGADREGPFSWVLQAPRAISGTVSLRGARVARAEVRLKGPSERTAVTSEKGEFRVERVRPGSYDVTAVSGDAIASQSVEISEGADLLNVALELEPGDFIRGVVVDERGAPVGDATVTFDDSETKSDARGGFSLGPLQLDPDHCEVSATRRGFLPGASECGLNREVRLTLAHAALLTGRVLGPDGVPPATFTVFARRSVGPTDEPTTDDSRLIDGTDGGFELDVQPGRWDLEFHSAFVTTHVLATAPGSVQVQLEAGLQIKGRFLDAEGQPVVGAEVVGVMAGDQPSGGVTDEDGRFTIAQLKPGTWKLVARLVSREGTFSAEGEAIAGAPGELVLRAAPGVPVAGRVIDDDGTPVAGVALTGSSGRRVARATSDDAGTFRMKLLPAGPFELHASALAQEVELELTAPDEQVVVRLPPKTSISGRVVDGRGDPIQKFLLFGQPQETTDGRFDFPMLPQRVSVTFAAEGTVVRRLEVDMKPGRNDLGDVVLVSGPTITGTVLGDGHPVVGAMISSGDEPVTDSDRPNLVGASSDAKGRFSVMVDPKTKVLLVAHPDWLPWSAPLPSGESPVTVTLSRGRTVTVRLLSGNGKPSVSALVWLAQPGLVRQAEKHLDGRYVAAALPGGTWTIRVRGLSGDVWHPRTIEVGD